MADVQILVAGEDLTDRVLFATAMFSSFVNGKPGEAYMRIRDTDQDYSVETGADWLVKVDGEAAWRGFVTQAIRTYIAPAMNVTTPGTQRFVDLRGADLNILLTKRIVSNHADRADVEGTQFPPGTPDTTAITELLDDWLDIGGDDLDTTSGVDHVGDLDPEQKTRAWSGSWTWAQAMDSIAMLPAAIYYIRPEAGSPKGTLVYCDVDVPTAPFGLSDQPNGTTTRGYREMEITEDGSSLANDVMAWGMGYGSQRPVFKRNQVPASIAEHGLWQIGKIVPGVYKQATINRIAESIIDGSPSSQRGTKDDKPSIRLTTYVPGLLAGHVVAFTSAVWDWSDNIPVRQMTVTFESPTKPRYDLVLSHEIDAPWSFIDSFWPQIPGIPIYEFCPDPPCFPRPGNGGPQFDSCDCGTTDDFERTVAFAGLGIATCGLPWINTSFTSDAYMSVHDGFADLNTYGPGTLGSTQVGAYLGPAGPGGIIGTTRPYADGVHTMTFKLRNRGFTPSDLRYVLNWQSLIIGGGAIQNIKMETGNCRLRFTTATNDGTLIPDGFFVDGTVYTWTTFWNGTLVETVISDGSTSYSCTIAASYPVEARLSVVAVLTQQLPFVGSDKHWDILDISMPELTRCSNAGFDVFDRDVATGWGASTDGHQWTVGAGTWTTDPGMGISIQTTSGREATVYDTNPDVAWKLPEVALTVVFQITNAPTTISDTSWLYTTHSMQSLVQMAITAGPPITGLPKSYIQCAGETTFIPPAFWVDDGVYTLVVERTGGQRRASISRGGTTYSTAFGTEAGPSDYFGVSPNINSGSQTFVFYSMKFEYPGSPCYHDCDGPPVAFDDFERTEASDWGTATPSGLQWTSPVGTLSVDGSAGLMSPPDSASANVSAGTVIAGESPASGPFRMDLLIKFDVVPTSNSFMVIVRSSDSVVGRLTFSPRSDGFSGVYLSTVSGSASFAYMAFTAGVWYRVAWVWAASTVGLSTVTVWEDGDPEPSTPTVTRSSFGIGSPGASLEVAAVTDAPHQTDGWAIASIDFTVCTPVDPTASAAPQTPTGFGCWDADRVSSTVYSVAGTFTPNSTFVWRKGLLQQRGVDYTENSDNAGITFASPVGANEEITICYLGGVMP